MRSKFILVFHMINVLVHSKGVWDFCKYVTFFTFIVLALPEYRVKYVKKVSCCEKGDLCYECSE